MYSFVITIVVALNAFHWACVVEGVENATQYVRRVQQPEVECITLLRISEFEDGTSEYEWNCQLLRRTPAAAGMSGMIRTIEGLENIPEAIFQKFQSAKTLVAIEGAIVTPKAILVPPGAIVRLEKIPDRVFDSRRRLQTIGNKKVIAIRVTSGKGKKNPKTTATAAEMSEEIFGTGGNDAVNLVSQFKACSFDQLNFSPLQALVGPNDPILPAAGTPGAGVYEVTVDWGTGDHVALRNAIMVKLNQDWPNTPMPEKASGDLDPIVPFDHMMLCMPPETQNMGIAYAFANHWLTVYKDNWCLYPSAQLHELGHNCGLDHSGEGGSEYGDQSGYMGSSYSLDEGPRMCFNAAKSFQLGFYSEKTMIFDPFDTPSWTGDLAGFVDFGSAETTPVLLKIETRSKLDFYINFNRQTGFNEGTKEGGNKVLITSQGEDGQAFSSSLLLAKLGEGQSFEIESFGFTALVSVISITTTASITITTQPKLSGFINCGPGEVDDGTVVWNADEAFVDKTITGTYTVGAEILNTTVELQEMYQSERYDLNGGENMVYTIPLFNGMYNVNLHEAEIYSNAEGARRFDVWIQGVNIFPDIDIFRDAGGKYAAHIYSVTDVLVSDGFLTIEFVKISQNPKCSGIEIHAVTSAPEPSSEPSLSIAPSANPSLSSAPSDAPSASAEPSSEPSLSSKPSANPSFSSAPSDAPSASAEPSSGPSMKQSLSSAPSANPSLSSAPSDTPSASAEPSSEPSLSSAPSANPSFSSVPSDAPSASVGPSSEPSLPLAPSANPSLSSAPSSAPSASAVPSSEPSLSLAPSENPSFSSIPSDAPSASAEPSSEPSLSSAPSENPSLSSIPSDAPSLEPSLSVIPSVEPSVSTNPPDIQAAWNQCSGRECSFRVRNEAAEAFTITSMVIVLPPGPRLRTVEQGKTVIWRGDANGGSTLTIGSWDGSTALRVLAANDEKVYTLVFSPNPPVDEIVANYSVEITLESPSGGPVSVQVG